MDLAADDAGDAGIALLPDVVADHQDGAGAGMLIRGQEAAAEDGLRVQHGKDAACRLFQVIRLRRGARLTEDATLVVRSLEGFKGRCLGAVVLKVGIRDGQAAITLRKAAVDDRDQARASGNGDGSEKHRADQRENHRIETDAQREGGHHGSRKPAVGQDHAQRESQIRSHEAVTKTSRGLFRN